MIDESDVLQGTFTVKRVPTPAFGFVTGIHQSSDGLRFVHWTDAQNGYLRAEGDIEWRPMFTVDTLPVGERTPWLNAGVTTTDDGVFSAWIDQTDSDNVWATYYGQMYYSTDFGLSWVRKTGFTPKEMESNTGVQRRFQPTLCGHPSNNTHFLCGTNNDGVYYTTDGWTTENAVAGLPAAGGSSKYLVYIDPGDPNYCYIHVPTSGLWRSTTGVSGTFSLVASSPTTCSSLTVTPAGLVLLVSYGVGTHRLWSMARAGAGFTNVTGSDACDAVTWDPFDPENHWVVTNENGAWIKQTYNAGATWFTAARNSTVGSQWVRGDGEVLSLTNREKAMFTAGIMLSRAVEGELFIAEGVGVNRSMCPADGVSPSVADPWVLQDWSAGNYELVCTKAFSIPDAPPFFMFMDKPVWRGDDLYQPNNMWSYAVASTETFGQSTVQVGTWLDYAPEDPRFCVLSAITNSPSVTQQYGYSWNRGHSFIKFPTQPFANTALSGGCVAVSTTTNFIVTGSQAGAVARYTLDGGNTWNDVNFGGRTPVTNWNSAWYNNRENIIADKANPGTFYALVDNTAGNAAIAGIWKTTDGGPTWTQVFSGVLQTSIIGGGSSGQNWGCGFKMVPGFPGELVYADCIGNTMGNGVCLLSESGGVITGTDANPLIRNLTGFGFGPPAPGQTRPSVWFYGYYNGTRGVYVSLDWWATATLVAEYPIGYLSNVTSLDVDQNVFGRALIGMSSYAYAFTEYESCNEAEVVASVPKVRIVPLAGDSNCVGRGSVSRDPILDGDMAGVWQWKNNSGFAGYQTFSSDITPLHHPDATVPASDRYGPGEQLGRSLKERYPDDEIVLVPCGTGGTSIATVGETWNPAAGGAATPTQYNYLVSSINACMAAAATNWPDHEIVTELVYWDGGANDVGSAVTGSAFYSAINNIIAQFRIDVPAFATTRWVLAGLPYDDALLAAGIGVERALLSTVASQSNVYYVKRIDDVPDDADLIHANQATNRDLGTRAAVVDLDTTVPIWPGLAIYNNTTGYKLEINFTGDFTFQGTVTSTTSALDADFEVANIFSTTRTLRWTADGTKSVGTYDPTLVIMGGNRQTLDVPLSVVVGTVGSVSPVSFFTASEKGCVVDLTDLTTLFQDVAGTIPVTTAGQVVGKVLDKSPNLNHWTAAADNTTRPTYQVDGDGKPYLQFDGSNDVLLALPLADPTNVVYAACMGIYAAPQSATKTILSNNSTTSGTPFASMFQCSGTTANLIQSVRNDSSGVPALTSVAALDSTKRIITHRYLPQSVTNGVKARDATARGAGGGTTYSSQTTIGGVQVSSFTRSGLGANSNSPVVNFYNGRVYSFYAIGRDVTNMEAANGEDWVNSRCRTSNLP